MGHWITVNGTHIFVNNGETAREAVERVFGKDSDSLTKHKKNGIVYLPKDEYAKLNSAVRTKYANKIPQKGTIFVGDFRYVFSYDRSSEQIVCKKKSKIKALENKISRMRERDGN